MIPEGSFSSLNQEITLKLVCAYCSGLAWDVVTDIVGIREGRPEDVQAVVEIYKHSWKASLREIVAEDYLSDYTLGQRASCWFDKAMDQTAEGFLLVAEHKDQMIGFSFAQASTEDGDDSAELKGAYVCPEHWGQGVSVDLINATEKRLAEAGFDEVWIWIFAQNEDSRRCYEQSGWHYEDTHRPLRFGGGAQLVDVAQTRYRHKISV